MSLICPLLVTNMHRRNLKFSSAVRFIACVELGRYHMSGLVLFLSQGVPKDQLKSQPVAG